MTIPKFAVLALAMSSTQVQAADAALDGKTDFGDVSVAVHTGVLTGVSHEYVYENGSKLSELIWKMNANPALNVDLDYDIGPRLALYAKGSFGLSGNNYMTDYDWLARPFFNGWTDRSQHNDTKLDRYFSIDAGLKYDFFERAAATFSLLGGLKYTEAKWTAYGGDYVYSSFALRDTIGSFPDGEKGISYRQSLPLIYSGFGIDYKKERFSLGVTVLGGATIGASDRDNHFMRDIYFLEEFEVGAYLGIKGKAAYAITKKAELFLSAAFDNYFTIKGPTEMYDLNTGALLGLFGGEAAGTSMQTLQVSAGMKFTF